MDDLIIRREAKDVVIETHGALLVVLDTELTETLVQEGHAREAIRYIQHLKGSGLGNPDRINLKITTDVKILSLLYKPIRIKFSGEVLHHRYRLSPNSLLERL